MEIEKKLGIPSKRKANKIWNALKKSNLDWIGKAQRLAMRADYFDTDDGRMRKNRFAFRIRREGTDVVATLKGKGSEENGLHIREEENIYLNENLFQRRAQKRFLKNPPADLFHETALGREAERLIENEPLKRVVSMHFTRRKQQTTYGDSVLEVAVDTGFIKGTGLRLSPIRELEVELIRGNPSDAERLSAAIAETYRLKPEPRSKFARGVALLGKRAERSNA